MTARPALAPPVYAGLACGCPDLLSPCPKAPGGLHSLTRPQAVHHSALGAPEPTRVPTLPQSPTQTPGERVLARVLALGDDHPSDDYRLAIGDVLRVLSECAPECHEQGHR